MEVLKAIVLGFLQGVTEFMPVSSSGHLVLAPWLLGWESPGLLFDTLVHWGTLVAVIAVFWQDWWNLARAWVLGLLHWDWRDPEAQLMWLLILASLPAALIGFLFEDLFESLFGKPAWVSAFLLVTAAILVLSEYASRRVPSLSRVRWTDALLIGFAQAAAIAPGISRSGATMSVGLVRGLTRPQAARFSFLLSTPAILGAGLFQLAQAVAEPVAQPGWIALLSGFFVAAASGYLSIRVLLHYLQRGKLHVFALYCAWVGMSCLVVASLR